MNNIRKTIITTLLFTAMTVLLMAVIPANSKAAPVGYYTISFSKNNISNVTVPAAFDVKDGALFTIPTQLPQRTGGAYTFGGYSLSPAANVLDYSPGQVERASKNLTLYPIWIPKDQGIKTYNYGTHLDLPKSAGSSINKPCKVQMYYDKDQKSFTFGGWAVHDQGIKKYTYSLSGSGFTSDKIKYFSWAKRDDVASHSPDVRKSVGVSTKASYNNCGYSGVVDMSKLGNGDYKLTVYGIPNSGSNFAVCEISFNIRPLGTAYVLFNANGGKGVSNGKQLVTYGANNKLSPPAFTRSGYTLMGFSTKKNATSVDFKLDKTYTFNGVSNNTTLYAVWGYKVVIDANGGTFHNGKTRVEYTFPVGTTQTIDFGKSPYDQYLMWLKGQGLGKAMEKPGYAFANNYSTNPKSEPLGAGRSLVFVVNSNTTLYPVWLSTTSKGGIWYHKNYRNKGYADVIMFVDKANANKFADQLQQFVLENGSKRKKIDKKEHWIADTIRAFSKSIGFNFFYDCTRYGLKVAVDNLINDVTLDKVTENTLLKYAKEGFDQYSVAYDVFSNTASVINVGSDATFKRNFDLLEPVYKHLVSQGIYNTKTGKANANGSICITISTETNTIYINGSIVSVLKNIGFPVIGENYIDYNALLRDSGGHWIDEQELQKPDSYYNKENDTMFTALYKVLSLTDGDKHISGPYMY